jgi:hypothetical protein
MLSICLCMVVVAAYMQCDIASLADMLQHAAVVALRATSRDTDSPDAEPDRPRQANLVKQLAKLVKVRYVEDITYGERVGEFRPQADRTAGPMHVMMAPALHGCRGRPCRQRVPPCCQRAVACMLSNMSSLKFVAARSKSPFACD